MTTPLRSSPTRRNKTSFSSSPIRLKSLLYFLIVGTLSSSVFLVVRYHAITTSTMHAHHHHDWPPSLRRANKNNNNENNIDTLNRRRTTQATYERRKRPPTESGTVVPAAYHLYEDSSLASSTNTNTTTNWKTLDASTFCGSHAQTVASTHGYMGDPLSTHSKVVITNILSPLGVSLALRLHLECHVQKIIGVDHILPNTRHYRMPKMDSYALLQRYIPTLPKLIVPEMGIPMSEILETHKPTHVVHSADSADSYLENVINMQDVLLMNDDANTTTTTTKLPHVVYITTKNATSTLSARAIHLVASSLTTVQDTYFDRSIIGLQMPHVYGEYDSDSLISQLTMDYLNTNETTVELEEQSRNQQCLFVDDAVDVLVAAMQVQPPGGNGFATIDIPSNQTLGMLQQQVQNIVLKRTKSTPTDSMKRKNDSTTTFAANYWLGWTPSTFLTHGVSTLVSMHLAHKYPYGNVEQTLAVPTPPQRIQFPCASECARSQVCTPTMLDDTVKVSKRLSRGCKYVIYTVDLWADVQDLPSSGEQSDDPEENAKWCRIAFVSSSSPLVLNGVFGTNNKTTNTTTSSNSSTTITPADKTKLDSVNGEIAYKNWTLVFVHGDAANMSEAEYSLLKIAPRTFFSSSVYRAMYVQANRFPVPPFESLTGFIKTLDPHERPEGRQKEYRSGSNIFRWLPKPAKKARRVLFSSLEASFPNVPPKSPIGVYVKARIDSEGIRPIQERLVPQVSFYTYAAHFVQVLPRRLEEEIRSTVWKEFPFEWLKTSMIVHDLRENESHKLRCEWYDETIFWGNAHLEDLSLAYVLAKRKIMGTTGVELEDDAGWFPLLNTDKRGGNTEVEVEPERLTNAEDTELFLRILPRPRTKT